MPQWDSLIRSCARRVSFSSVPRPPDSIASVWCSPGCKGVRLSFTIYLFFCRLIV